MAPESRSTEDRWSIRQRIPYGARPDKIRTGPVHPRPLLALPRPYVTISSITCPAIRAITGFASR